MALLFWTFAATHSLSAQTSTVSARKFDEFGDAQLSDIAARLDNFAITLQNEPQMKAFVIAYRSRRDLPGLSGSLAAWLRNYLISTRGFSAERIIAIDGGVASCVSQELWLVPPGVAPTPRGDAYTTTFYDPDSPRKFYEATYYAPDFSSESYSFDVSHSFEGFSEALRRDPKSRGYLIAYAGYRIDDLSEFNDQGVAIRHGRRIVIESIRIARKQLLSSKKILVEEYKIPASRIKVIFGGYRGWPFMELWLVPRNGPPPIPTPDRFPKRNR
jgi:hypothetical protein